MRPFGRPTFFWIFHYANRRWLSGGLSGVLILRILTGTRNCNCYYLYWVLSRVLIAMRATVKLSIQNGLISPAGAHIKPGASMRVALWKWKPNINIRHEVPAQRDLAFGHGAAADRCPRHDAVPTQSLLPLALRRISPPKLERQRALLRRLVCEWGFCKIIPYLKKNLEDFWICLEYLVEFYGFRKAIVLVF